MAIMCHVCLSVSVYINGSMLSPPHTFSSCRSSRVSLELSWEGWLLLYTTTKKVLGTLCRYYSESGVPCVQSPALWSECPRFDPWPKHQWKMEEAKDPLQVIATLTKNPYLKVKLKVKVKLLSGGGGVHKFPFLGAFLSLIWCYSGQKRFCPRLVTCIAIKKQKSMFSKGEG